MNEEELEALRIEALRNELGGLNSTDLENRRVAVRTRLANIEFELQNLQKQIVARKEGQVQINVDELKRQSDQLTNERKQLNKDLSEIEAEILNRILPPDVPWPPEPRLRGRL